jgi:hypothetical protein
MKRLIQTGADGFFTDRVKVAVDLFAEMGLKQKKALPTNLTFYDAEEVAAGE